MDNKKIRAIGAVVLVALWAILAGFAWFGPAEETSVAERRPLAQMPEISLESILDGKFMTDFEDYSLDQFPLRDGFRTLKSLFHLNVLNQGDNNDIYIVDGVAAKQEYPLSDSSLAHAIDRFTFVYEKYLKDNGSTNIQFAIVPDKSFYLAETSGHLTLDYEKMFADLETGMPWANFVDITGCLEASDYYATDTHWRQEHLIPVAEKLCAALGVTAPKAEDFIATAIDRPFYGVYYGQAALPMDPETIYTMNSALLDDCTVYNYETGKYTDVYDMEKLDGKDLYEVFLSGPQSLLTIENPNATTDKELLVFRDSFGNSLVPLLVQDYQTVTLIDIRYLPSAMLSRYVDFHGQDVLFMYSTSVLNNSSTIK